MTTINRKVNTMKLTKNNIGKEYFDASLVGQNVIINFSHWATKPTSTLTGQVEIQSNCGEPELMYEVDGYGFIWEWILITKAEVK